MKVKTLYHGTNTWFEEFSNDFLGTENSIDQYGSGFYFYEMASKTTLHGDLRVTAKVEINKSMEYSQVIDPIDSDFVESLILESPDLEYKLENWGDLEYEGFDNVLETAINGYTGYTDYISLLNVIGNDFFDGKDTHILLKKFVKMTGIDCFTDSKRGIYVILTKRQIEIQSVTHEEED